MAEIEKGTALMSIDLLSSEQTESFVNKSLAMQPERLRHVYAMAELARQSARDINERCLGTNVDENLVYCAALLHDIGYAEEVKETGFHPLDGYRFLMEKGFARLASCIVHHGCAQEEAELLGFELPEQELSLEAKLITYWDMQVKQGGEIVSYEERYQDIIQRYGEHSLVGQANILAQGRIQEIINEVNRLLGKVVSSQ